VERETGVPVRYFMLRRAARIFPIYYLLLLALTFVHPHPSIKWCALYLSNYHGPLSDSPPDSWLQHTWSLCVEEHFYSCWPLLVTFLPLRWSRRLILGVIVPGAILSGVILTLLPQIGPLSRGVQSLIDAGTIDRFARLGLVLFGTQTRILSLALGALLAYHENTLRRRVGRSLLLAGVGLAAALALSMSTPRICSSLQEVFGRPFPLQEWSVLSRVVSTSLATSSTLLIVIAIEGLRHSPLGFLSWTPLRAIGRISYGLYLFHITFFQFLGIHRLARQGETLRAWSVIVTLLLVSTLSYLAVERPILRWSSRFRSARITTSVPPSD